MARQPKQPQEQFTGDLADLEPVTLRGLAASAVNAVTHRGNSSGQPQGQQGQQQNGQAQPPANR